MPAADLFDAVVAVAAEAGALAMKSWRGEFRRGHKADGSPISEVDLAVDAFLRERLGALLPDAGWLSEETADAPDRLAKRRVWVVDPIDGTRAYVQGRDGWCVSVALIEDTRVVLGVLDAPARQQVWRAAAGAGAWRGADRLRAGDRALLDGARVPAVSLPKADRLFACVEQPNSIALRIAMVAADDADLVATLRWGSEWDIAAAALIAAEAGARVTDALGLSLVFNKPNPQAFGVLATAPGLHRAAVEHLAERAGRLASMV